MVFSACKLSCTACRSQRSVREVQQFQIWGGPYLNKTSKLQVIQFYFFNLRLCHQKIAANVLPMWLPVFGGWRDTISFGLTVCPGEDVVVVCAFWVWVPSCWGWDVKRAIKETTVFDAGVVVTSGLQMTSEVVVPVIFTPADLHLE